MIKVRFYISLTALCVVAPAVAQTVAFERDVWPVLESRCIKCHRPPFEEDGKLKKPKAGLVLDSARGITRGSEDGAVIVPGKPNESTLYTLTRLDEDDEDIMPAKGDPLTVAQQTLLHDWIQQGAVFGKWKGNQDALANQPVAPATPAPAIVHPLDILGKGLPRIAPTQYKTVPKATVTPVSTGNALLRVAYINDAHRVTDMDVSKLAPLMRHVTDLDLSGTMVTDKSLRMVGGMRHLTRLDLHGTAVTDSGLTPIRKLARLESLNLHSTALTDQCLAHIARLPHLSRLYLWNTQITQEGIDRLQKALPGTHINYSVTMPYPELAPTNSITSRPQKRRRPKK